MKDYTVSTTLYWSIIGFMAILFVAIVIFNGYLFVLDNQLTQKVNLSRVNSLQKANLVIDYNNGQKKMFEGEVPMTGLTLYDALLLSTEAGNLNIEFSIDEDGKIHLVKIDNFLNNEINYWEIQIPNINWSKNLNAKDVDLKQIYIAGGARAYLIYK